jgi:hypothetical protein
MAQAGPSDYRMPAKNVGREEQSEGIMDQVGDVARDMTERAEGIAGELGAAIKERPYTTLAIAAGLAFVAGAVWKLGKRSAPSHMDRLAAQLPKMPNRRSIERWWHQQGY